MLTFPPVDRRVDPQCRPRAMLTNSIRNVGQRYVSKEVVKIRMLLIRSLLAAVFCVGRFSALL